MGLRRLPSNRPQGGFLLALQANIPHFAIAKKARDQAGMAQTLPVEDHWLGNAQGAAPPLSLLGKNDAVHWARV